MFEDLIGKMIIVERRNSKLIFGTLLFEDDECVKLELNDKTIFTIPKSIIISGRPFKETGLWPGQK